MQDYGCGFSQGETRMGGRTREHTLSQTDRKFSQVTRSTVSHVGGLLKLNSMISKVTFLFVYLNWLKTFGSQLLRVKQRKIG